MAISLDAAAAEARLVGAGVAPERARPLGALTERCAAVLPSADRPLAAWFVPGRIEVLGKHTDYGGGRSLLIAAERGVCMVAAARVDDVVVMTDAVSSERITFRIDPDLAPDRATWANYPMTVTRRVARDFPGRLRGADIALAGTLPVAAGLSSSSALIVATFLVLAALSRLTEDAAYRSQITTGDDLADYLAAVESGRWHRAFRGDAGVGTRGGGEDHVAILRAGAGQVVQYAFAPTRFERAISLPAGLTFVVASSGVRAEKTGGAMAAYNRAADLLREAAAFWRATTGRDDQTIGEALESGADAETRLLTVLNDARASLRRRVEHFIEESRRLVPTAGDALAARDLATFADVVDRSQRLAEDLLGNQTPETVHLARSARGLGAVAASAFGAGFGGSVWALVPRADAARFAERWRDEYRAHFAARAPSALFFASGAGPGAVRLV